MRIFVYEYLCSGALADQPTAASLRREGLTMLRSILEDLSRCPDVRLLTMLDPALIAASPPWPDNLLLRPLSAAEEERAVFAQLAMQADRALVIAPEFDDLLWQRCRWLEELDVPHLGPSAAAVRQTGDKLALAQLWQQAGVPTPACWPSADAAPSESFPCILKPRYGAGSQATFLVQDRDTLASCLQLAREEGWQGELLLQSYVPGLAASMAFLLGPGQLHALPAVQQLLSDDGRFRYQGGRLPLPAKLNERARRVATRSVQAVAGLHGYVGVDLILGPASDGSLDYAVEINPRLTTSYVGLRRLAQFNLAETLLTVASGSVPPEWRWHTEAVSFAADGSITGEHLPADTKPPIM